MKSCAHKVLFLHGLDSSRESTKFEAIDAVDKLCINVDYRNLNFSTVESFYCEMIEKIKPKILVGHSLGGYWALKMSKYFELPAVIANPSLSPNFREDYPQISEQDLDHDIPQFAYIELGDELLDMYATADCLESYMHVEKVEGGHHRLDEPEKINQFIYQIEQLYLCPKA
ncbi:esterase [Acinetobacter sp. 187]|uniref:Esterase n=1 Tax=Acinetobacter lanii TaxID=2715163 RepID=A0A6G8S6I3_9GAMM|nr:YqiA/YcfP family alpha/beta fold hydrolase [Acinetobacter lanii]NHC04431.1 esterase [Acinetobacter lanii]QIO09573.1 esterase [Acinetobacter lanii]